MYSVYVPQSIKTGRYYIGHTRDISDRLRRHNTGNVRSTKHGIPWKIRHTEQCEIKPEAYQREMEIKSYKSGIKFKKLLGL